MLSTKFSLKNMLNKIDWVQIQNKHGNAGSFNPLSLKISLMGKNKMATYASKINLYIGLELMKQLDWKINDKVLFFHAKDDLAIFMGIKNEKGYKITKSPNSYCGMISMVWPHTQIKMNKTPAYECNYEIDENNHSIAFRVTDNPDV